MSRIATIVNDLRNGLGAIKLRSDVKKVTLVFSGKSDNAGARYYFGHQVMPPTVSPSGPLYHEERQGNRMFTGGTRRVIGLHGGRCGRQKRVQLTNNITPLQESSHHQKRQGRSVLLFSGVLFSPPLVAFQHEKTSSEYNFKKGRKIKLIHKKHGPTG